MSEYTIAVTIQDFKRITETLSVDKSNKDKFHIRGNYISLIEPYINSHEQLNVKLKPSNAVIYKRIERGSTPYLRINANCTLCSETNKYLILIKDKPNENEQKELDTFNCGVYVAQYLKCLIKSNTNLTFVNKNSLAQLEIIRSDMLNEFNSFFVN